MLPFAGRLPAAAQASVSPSDREPKRGEGKNEKKIETGYKDKTKKSKGVNQGKTTKKSRRKNYKK